MAAQDVVKRLPSVCSDTERYGHGSDGVEHNNLDKFVRINQTPGAKLLCLIVLADNLSTKLSDTVPAR